MAVSAAGADSRGVEVVPKTAAPAGQGTRWAVVIGVNEYAAPGLSPLRGAVADAKALSRVLVERAGFPAAQVYTLTSGGPRRPQAETVLQTLADIRAAAGPDDLLLFFFAGHGIETEGQRFLLTEDARISSAAALKLSSLSVNLLMQELENLPVAHRILMIDACRDDPMVRARRTVASENFATSFILKAGSPRGVRATFLSCTTGQSAYEWTEKGRGFFSYFIERGLEGEAAQFGKVTVSSLDSYLNEMVPRAVRESRGAEQTPFVDRSGEALVLVEGAAPAPAAPTPPPVRRVYGMVKNSGGEPLPRAALSVSWAATPPRRVDVDADDDGFFTVEVPSDAIATVTAAPAGFQARTVTAGPEDAGTKLQLFLVSQPTPAPTAAPPATPAGTPAPPTASPRPTATPEGPGLELARAAYQAFVVEDFEQAETLARNALEADPSSALAAGVLATTLAVDGVNQAKADRIAEAETIAGRALALVPTLALGHNAKGLVAWSRGDGAAARREFELASRLDPRMGAAQTNLGFVLLKSGRYKDAERAYREAIRVRPDSAVPYNGLAQVLLELDREAEAVKAAREAIARYQRQDRYLGLFYVNLAVALHQQKNTAEAREAVSRARELGVVENPAYRAIEGP